MTDLETLAQQVLNLEAQRQRAVQRHNLLETEFRIGSQNLSALEFASAKAGIEQAAQLVAELTMQLREAQTTLNAVRHQAEFEMQREQALASIHTVMNRLQMTESELNAKHLARREVETAIAQLTTEHSALLNRLSMAKDQAASLGAI